MQRYLLSITLAVSVILLSVACAGKTGNAVAALKKIQAATQTGVNHEQYTQLVIEAKAAVNEVSSKLPEGEFKRELEASMEAYADAGQAWGIMIKGRTLYADGPGSTWDKKYSLGLPYRGELVYDDLQRRDVVSRIWDAAEAHLNRASELAG